MTCTHLIKVYHACYNKGMFKKATVDAASVAATLTDYPTYIDLARVGITTLAEAHSVRIYSDEAKTTELAREIVSVTECHCKIPSLTTTTDIYIDADGVRADLAVGATYGRNNVWSASYAAVYHHEALLTDSTSNGRTLTNNNSVTQDASTNLGQGANYGATNTNRKLAQTANLITGNFTATAWFRLNTEVASGLYGIFSLHSNVTRLINIQCLYSFNGGTRRLEADYHKNNQSDNNVFWASGALGTSAWSKADITYDGTTFRFYGNGVSQGTPLAISGGGSSSVSTTGYYGGEAARYSAFGPIDISEFRILTSELSANWITTEYNNQNAEATFWGTWTTVSGGSPAQAARRGVIMMM